jgi:hypothetical protein
MENFKFLNIPLCLKYAEVARPNILMFGDWVGLHSEQIRKRYHNTTLIRINPREYELDSHLGFSIQKGGLDGLRQLLL